MTRIEHNPECSLVVAQRGWWAVTPPRCTCGLVQYVTAGAPREVEWGPKEREDHIFRRWGSLLKRLADS